MLKCPAYIGTWGSENVTSLSTCNFDYRKGLNMPLEAFEYNVVDFLVKPVKEDRFKAIQGRGDSWKQQPPGLKWKGIFSSNKGISFKANCW